MAPRKDQGMTHQVKRATALQWPFLAGGEGGIRTHGRFDPTPDFESGTFGHSATSPVFAVFNLSQLNCNSPS